jgi:tetratricopeptide (TPR) repeat protein
MRLDGQVGMICSTSNTIDPHTKGWGMTEQLSISVEGADDADKPVRFWHVPGNRNPHFTGRDRVLELLARALEGNDPETRKQVLHGVGGVGKTHVALEYVYRHREHYDLVWWLPAEDESALAVAYAKLVQALGGHAPVDATPDELCELLQSRLKRFGRWLLVFDNAASAAALQGHVPNPGGHGAVLITSRDPNWRGTAQPFCLRVFERPDSVAFLKKRTDRNETPAIAQRLAQALGDLPLALEQAGALIAEAQITYAHYLSRFEDHWAELLRSGRTSGEYPDTVAMTWELGFRQLEQTVPMAAALLNVCAYFAPVDISRAFLTQAGGALPRPLSTAVETPVGLNALVSALTRYSLVAANEKSLSVHRLIGALTRDRLPEDHQRNWCGIALRMMHDNVKFDETAVDSWIQRASVIPHALAVTKYAEDLGVEPAIAAQLLNNAGQLLFRLGQFTQARLAFERALALTVQAHGAENPRRSAIENNLGRVLNRLGEHRRAKEHFVSAIAVDQAAYGESHPHVAESANNYGISLQIAGDVEDAMRQFEWALSVVETHYGPEHPKVASVVNNLGYSLAGLGDLDRAMNHFARALATAEASYGPNHPACANIRTNLGIVMRLHGSAEVARREFERALSISESVLGPHHPDVARNLTHLGVLLHQQEEFQDARRHFERALAIEERTLGPNHYSLITKLNYLGRCLKRLGKVDESADCYARSAGILRQLRETSASEQAENAPAAIAGSGEVAGMLG